MSITNYQKKISLISLIVMFTIPNFTFAGEFIKLPEPTVNNEKGLATLLIERFSCRNFREKVVDEKQISSLLWAAGGKNKDSITGATRTIPSAGAVYPLEIFILIGKSPNKNIGAGIYQYNINNNSLTKVTPGDKRQLLAKACWGQSFIEDAPISIIISAVFSRTTARYGKRGVRYVHMDTGGACQNVYLMATNLGLGTVEVGAFDDNLVKKVLNLKSDLDPLAIMPVGYPK